MLGKPATTVKGTARRKQHYNYMDACVIVFIKTKYENNIKIC